MSKLVVCRLVVLTLVLVTLLGAPVSAVHRDLGCFKNMARCFEDTALVDSFWYRTWDALDCELGFISCVRVAVFGL